jgi:hypothetical protein
MRMIQALVATMGTNQMGGRGRSSARALATSGSSQGVNIFTTSGIKPFSSRPARIRQR